jgi:hypothetical protein
MNSNLCSEIVPADEEPRLQARVILRSYRRRNDKTEDPQPAEPHFKYDEKQYDLEEDAASYDALHYR